MREIIFYETANSKRPVEDFLDSLSAEEAKKVAWVLKLFEDPDVKKIPSQFFKKLINTDDIWEVRVNVRGKAIRILGFLDGENLVVLAHAVVKKTQKTPRNAVKIAEERKRITFQEREVNDERSAEIYREKKSQG